MQLSYDNFRRLARSCVVRLFHSQLSAGLCRCTPPPLFHTPNEVWLRLMMAVREAKQMHVAADEKFGGMKGGHSRMSPFSFPPVFLSIARIVVRFGGDPQVLAGQ
jgi:hypothetical protein